MAGSDEEEIKELKEKFIKFNQKQGTTKNLAKRTKNSTPLFILQQKHDKLKQMYYDLEKQQP